MRTVRLISASVLGIALLLITSTAESNISLTRKLDTLHVIPSDVDSTLWQNTNATLIQDVSEDAIYQHFSKSNSAFISSSNVSSGKSSDSVNEPVETTPQTDSVDTNQESSTNENNLDETPVDADEQIDTNISEPESSSEQSTDAVSGETALQSMSKSFFTFTKIARSMLPFAQESIITPIESEPTPQAEEVVTNPEPQPEDGQASQDEVAPQSTETPQTDAQVSDVNAELETQNVDNEADAISDGHEDDEEPELPQEVANNSSITFTDFDLPQLSSGQFITNAQLRVSLAGLTHIKEGGLAPSVEVEYSSNGEWFSAGSVLLDGEVSNALNGGYFLFALPQIANTSELTNFAVRLSYVGDFGVLDELYIDSVWLDIDTETFDRTTLEERLIPEDLSYVKLPEMHELISPELDFGRTEDLSFVLRYESQRNAVVRFFRSIFASNLAMVDSVKFIRKDGGVADIKPEVNTTADGLWTIQLSPEDEEKLQPGTYTIQLIVDEGGKMYTDTLDFQWGMLAINPNQTEYTVGDTAHVSLAALSSSGNTICDAELALYVIDPNQFITRVPVVQSGLCVGNNVIDSPDYLSQVSIDTVGTYEMYVEHLSPSGEVLAHTSDTFTVAPEQDIWIERNGPTRIYPPALYPMQITVSSMDAFTGRLIERVPGNFTVSDTDALITQVGDEQELSWEVSLSASSSATFAYSFDAPDISPYLYNLGPAEVLSEDTSVVISETLPTVTEEMLAETVTTPIDNPEQTASAEETISAEPVVETVPEPEVIHEDDAPIEEAPVVEEVPVTLAEEPGFFEQIVDTLFGSDESVPSEPVPQNEEAGQIPVTPAEEPGFFEQVVDTLFGEEIVPPPSEPEVVPLATSTEIITSDTGATGTQKFVEHRKWQIASDATGSMLLYWASTTIPSGWTCVSCRTTDVFYQRFILGSSTPGINGGTTTHTHTASGAVGVSGATGVSATGGGGADTAVQGHGHSFTPTIASASNTPPYRNLVVIQSNSAGSPSSIPQNAIAIFDATVPSGWTRYSPQDGVYPRAESTTTVGTVGGTATHTHAISGTTGTSDTNTNGPGTTGVSVATNNHTHTVSTTTVALNHEPKYIEVILGKLTSTSSPTDAMIAMWTDTPPSGWSDLSTTSGAFSERFIKASTTYGGTGGAATSTHPNIANIVSAAPVGTALRTAGGTSDATGAHTHPVSVTGFSVASNSPPYRTAIFAKRGIGGAVPSAPTVHVLFDNEKTGTSTPQFEFTGDDPDGVDTLVYQFQWDDDSDLESAPIGDRTSDNESGCSPNCFSNTASTSDTSPFNDNERIRFTIQTPLTTNTTYYWRVRAKESVGDTWSSWTTVRSVTYESGVDPSMWYQTQGSQFTQGTLSNVATTSGEVQLSTTSVSVPTVATGWRTNTAAGSASLTLAKPSSVEVGDLLIIMVGNDDNTATAQWNDTTLKPTGFSLINETGDNTSDAHSAAFYRIADGTESATTSVPAQVAANYWGFYMRVTGASTTNPINVVGTDYSVNNLASHPITSITSATNTLAFYLLSADGGDTYPFSVSGTGWTESAEIQTNTGATDAAGTWGTRSMTAFGSTGNATVAMTVTDGASGFQFSVNPSLPKGSIMSQEVDFDSVLGQTDWGEVAWSVTEPSNTDTKLRVYYSSTTACDTIVPDSALVGNSAGFDASASGFHINNLSTTTYNRICVKMNFDLGTGASSPILNEWSIRWIITTQFIQSNYQWYVNEDSLTPTDPWPVGATDLVENEAIDIEDGLLGDDTIRLRMSLTGSSTLAATSSVSFKLQYAEGSTCSVNMSWQDVGDTGSTTALWRGYNNPSVADATDLPSTLLTGSTVYETYEEQNNSFAAPRSIGVGSVAEWDWVLHNNAATAGATFCFRMVYSDGTILNTYTNYPTLFTNSAPGIPVTYTPFDNEKIASTSPQFEFVSDDPEGQDIDYQVVIDNDSDFSSAVIDTESSSNLDDFINTIVPSDKSPFNNAQRMRYTIPSALTNGVTYYWRVRAIDPNGSNSYGEWSTSQSFTVDTSVTISTWFQTTEAQFDTDTLEGTDATGANVVAFASGSTTGTTTSSVIDFSDATIGNAWGEFSFNETGSAGNILYHLEYFDGSVWTLIPDTGLAGNSTGFDTSPVDLLDLDTSVYSSIRIRANFISGTPTILDWTITWGQRVSVATHQSPFDNEKFATTSPTFQFSTTDPESDDLEYEISWSTDYNFLTGSTTRNSSTSPTGFVNLTTGSDTQSPFISGDTISYTVQSGDVLTASTTYWWRVRAKDPADSNSYSFWSEPWSFTTATSGESIVVSTWFQTLGLQFDKGSLSGVTSATGSVSIGSGIAIDTGWTSNTAVPGVTLSLNKPANIVAGDLLLILVGNDNNTATAQWNNTTLKPQGFTLINEAGNATPDTHTAAFYRIANGTESSATSTTAQASANYWGYYIRVTGVDGNNPIDATSTDYAVNNLLSHPITATTTRTDGALAFYLLGGDGGDTFPFSVSGTGWSERAEIQAGVGALNAAGTWGTRDMTTAGATGNATVLMTVNDGASGFQFALKPSAVSSGSVYSPGIDFDDGSGPVWGTLAWRDTEPGSSQIIYQIEYRNSLSEWGLIPDIDLAGNSTGFTSTPVDLGSLDTNTYNEIRLVANFNCSGGNCPTLNDWTVTWSRGFTISGTAFEYDGVSSTTSGTVAVAVDGVLQTGKTGTIASNGTWSIDYVTFFSGDVVTVFVSDATTTATAEAVAITQYDGTPGITGMRLQKRHLTIGSDDYATISNDEIKLYDFSNNENLFFDVDAGNDLTVCADVGCSDASIRVLARNTYNPGTGANVTTHDFINYGTFTAGANTVRVSGSWDDNATSTLTGSSVIFTATSSSETIDETSASTTGFNNVTFGETSGTATWRASSTLDINGNLNVTFGTFNRATSSITIAGNLTTGASGFWTGMGTTTFDGTNPSTWTDQNTSLQNIGRVVVDGNAKTLLLGSTTTLQSLTVGADDAFDASVTGYTVSVYENWVINNTFTARTGKVIFIATTTNRVITAGGDAFYNLSFNGVGGSWSFTESDLGVTNDFSVSTGTVTMPTGTTTIAGSFASVGGTFAHNNALMYFTSGSAETIAASTTQFTNNFYNLRFTGSGSWSFLDTSATTSNDITITQGTVTFPSNTLTIGGSFAQSGGSFAHNAGVVRFTSALSETIDINSSSFNSLTFAGTGSWSFMDASVTALDDILVSAGTLTLPSGTLTLGGSFTNTATTTHNSGTILFNSTDGGETISLGNSTLYNMTFNGANGGWTITSPATTTNNFTLSSTSSFTLSSGQTLAVFGTFTNSVGGASTTWTGSILSLEAGNYALNNKTNTGDSYETLRVKSNTDIKMWNSSAVSYAIDATGSLYSQDHNAVDGDLYIFGEYVRTSGTEYWSYATDFDGTTLIASTSRQVDVRFANGASALMSTSTLAVVGTAGATTTIQNQGSGTYLVNVLNGTTTASYYDFSNLGLTGVTLASTTKVTTLADGRFAPGIASGTGLTVSATTIDANPGLQIYRVDFSTTTAISARNVTQNDAVPTSYWWFRDSRGNIGGEAFDNDSGDPGSVRWDDSSLVVTLSGSVYSDDGVTKMSSSTCNGVTQNIRVVVQGGASYTGSCAALDGTYSIGGVVIVGDPVVTVYLDTNGGAQGTVVTKTITANISDLDIYQNRVMTRHEDVSPLTILNMASFDNDDDSDVRYVAATGTLTVMSNTELHIASSTTFAPGGSITINGNASSSSHDGSLHIDDNATLTESASSTYTIAGSFTMDTGALFTSASGTVIMNATTTGKTINTGATQEIIFNTLTFDGVGGGWNINGDVRANQNINVTQGTVTGTADVRVVNGSLSGNGTLSFGAGTTTIDSTNTLGGTTAWTFANLVLGSGSVVGTTTMGSNATTTILGKLTVSTGHFFNAGGLVLNLAGTGNVFTESGTFVEATSTVRYSGMGATNVISTNYYNLDLKAQGLSPTYTGTGLGITVTNNLTIGGSTTTVFTLDTNDPALDINGNITIDSTGTLSGSGSAVCTIAGNWDNNGTYTANGGTVTFDGSSSSAISAGASSFGSVTLNGSGAFTITEHATATNAFTLTNTGSFTVTSGQTLAVGGTFTNGQGGAVTTWTGSTLSLYGGGNYSINASTTSDVYETLRVGSGTQIRMWNSSASTYDLSSTASLYSQDHAGVNGDLNIFGAYTKTSGTDYWSYATDFDGTIIGGSPRAVAVHIASGGSVLYTGGGLAVIGTTGASTTIQNQGSGTYAMRIGGSASTTWSHYQIRNTDTSGLTFSGTPIVNTLSNGDFEVSQNFGTGITVGGTVITQNPAKTFTNLAFATSTGVTPAFNVTATGTTISSWRFTNHEGTIDGEEYDSDPGGDPGYLVWADSASLITIAGVVYADEGVTFSGVCDDVTENVHLQVAEFTSYTTTCNALSGAYSFTGVSYGPNDSFIVYIDGETEKAATVSVDPISNIGNMDLYENRVIVRHENSSPISIVDLAVWDSTDDADVPFTAIDGAPDTLVLPANRKLIVWNGKTFTPNGNVTVTGGGAGQAYDGTLELYANATFDATGGEAHTIGGSLVSGSGAVIDEETATFTFTTTGSSRAIDTNDSGLYNVILNGSGSWSVSDVSFNIGNDFTIAQGAVTLPSGTTTVTGSLSVTGGSFNANGGTFLFNSGSAETIRTANSSFNRLTLNGLGSFAIVGSNATVTEDVRIVDGTFTGATGTLAVGGNFINRDIFTHGSGVLKFTSASPALITTNGSDLYSTLFTGSGAFTFTNTNVALLGSLTIQNGSVALASGTMSIAGSFLNTGGSFEHSSGTILFNSSDTGESINPGSSPFSNVTFASAGGGWTITSSATTTGNFSLTTATNFTQSSSTALTVRGVFTNLVGGAATTWTGSTINVLTGSTYTINSKTAGGDTYNNIYVASSTALRAWDSAGTITMGDESSSFYSQDHAGVTGSLYIFGNYSRTTGTDYWSYTADFDGASLLGGSSRQVFVYIAGGATTTLNGGTLSIIGANGFDTTISNQGSGTYAMNILGGTLNAQYYSLSNMDGNGLSFQGTPTITALTEGNFTLAVDGGSLITLSSTTLNYNSGLIVTGASFGTTTAITGYNVEVVGTTPSTWTFTTHTGNIDGESFDSDGGDDCGSVRWDDSVCLLTQQSGYRWRNDNGGEGVPDSEWFDLDWAKRKRVKVTNSDAVSYTDAAVKMTVTYDSDMQTDFDDLRFTSSDGLTSIPHFIETYTPSASAVVWVKVPTLATSTDTEVFMYYSNGTAGDTSTSTTFSMIDTFEDGGNTEYSGDTGEFTVDSSGAYERTYRLEASDPDNGKTDLGGMYNNSAVVQQGQTLRFLKYIDTGTGSGDEVCTLFGTQSQTQNYAVCFELYGIDRISLARDVDFNDTSGTILATTSMTYTTGWYEVEVDWGTNNRIGVSVSRNGSVVATTAATSSTYTSGGIGYALWFYHGAWDVYSARPLIATDPTVSFGAEQVPGGATWIAGLNTAGSGINIGDKARLRFLVENTGLPITNQNFEIEFAPKGASPSCEAVSYASYVEVPNVAVCGTSDICMESSSYITNLASTTDILGGAGTFTYGQTVEDPGNNTGNISVNGDEFTELEYVVTPTVNVTDSNYCFRVSNEGTDLDAYTHIAEFNLMFAPNITSLTLNGGYDITLVGGATTTIYATGTVTDLNGYADLRGATSTIFRSGVGESCSADNNNCYISGNSLCSFVNCSGDSCDVECRADIFYHADPTDAGSTFDAQTWRALLAVSDYGGSVATATAPSIDLLTLSSLSVEDGINYGSLGIAENTGTYNATTTLQNTGNNSLDVAIEGTDLTDGVSSAIPVWEQIFATSTFDYNACVYCSSLATTSTNYQVDLTKPTTYLSPVTDEIFWGIEIPYGVSGAAHSGVNTFYAVSDTP